MLEIMLTIKLYSLFEAKDKCKQTKLISDRPFRSKHYIIMNKFSASKRKVFIIRITTLQKIKNYCIILLLQLSCAIAPNGLLISSLTKPICKLFNKLTTSFKFFPLS